VSEFVLPADVRLLRKAVLIHVNAVEVQLGDGFDVLPDNHVIP